MKKIILGFSLLLFMSGAVYLVYSNYLSNDCLAGRGCCSSHGGVCGCSGGRSRCCDGTLSPSCQCFKDDVKNGLEL